MKNTTKFLSVLLALSMTAGLAACGSKETEKEEKDDKTKKTEASGDTDDTESQPDATTTEATEATTEETTTAETTPAIPDGYEQISFTDTKFGVEVTMNVLSGGLLEQKYDDTYYTYEMADKSDEGYRISYKFDVIAVNYDDDFWAYKTKNSETIDGGNHPIMYNPHSESLQYLSIWGGECYNGQYLAKITLSNSEGKYPEDAMRELAENVGRSVEFHSIGSDEFTDADGNFVCTQDYIKFGKSMTVDGKEMTPYIYIDEGESAYPYWKVDFENAEGEHIDVLARGGYNGTYYNARLENDDWRQCMVSGYPAICHLSNDGGKLVAEYVIVLGHEDRETSDGDKYEEDVMIYEIIDGDYGDDFIKDLIKGSSDHPELYERMDAYAGGYLDAVIYTPLEGATPVEKQG
ncbi:MAG: hypothetical protein J5636_02610 [Clostridiales bacterium]|nr:hypothetical protein [Clostridiales bacterium]